jgi:C-terminal processing protease CtpA/Prc
MKKRILLGLVLMLTSVSFSQANEVWSLFQSVVKILREEYVNPKNVNIEQLIALGQKELQTVCQKPLTCTFNNAIQVIQKMVRTAKDPHLVFYTDLTENNTVGDPNPSGRFGFVGQSNGKKYIITFIYPESPASKQGLKVGDQITAVNKSIIKPDELSKILRKQETSYTETLFSKYRSKNRFNLNQV